MRRLVARLAPLAVVVTTSLVAGCKPAPAGETTTATDAGAPQVALEAEPTPTTSGLRDLVTHLAGSDDAARDAALTELDGWRERELSADDTRFLIHAATLAYPPPRSEAADPIPVEILRVVEAHAKVEDVAAVRAAFPDLAPPARTEALSVLGAVSDPLAAHALLDLIEEAQKAGFPPEVSLDALERQPRFPKIYFPRILASAKRASALGILELTLAYASRNFVSPQELAPYSDLILAPYASLAKPIASAQAQPGSAWMWDDDYQSVREEASFLLELFGYVPSPRVTETLVEATRDGDPRLAARAAISLLRLGHTVDASVIERCATNDEVRNWLFDELAALGKGDLFPTAWATQEAFAQSALVSWLVYPAELGRAPDEVELMKTYSRDSGPPDGVLKWYLFRFRTAAPHWSAKDGWVAGLAGPFKESDEPSTTSYGDTFSAMTPWGKKTPRQHLLDLLAITERGSEDAQRDDETAKK